MIKRSSKALSILIGLLFFNYVFPALAVGNNSSSNIEKIVTTENGKIVYYRDGSKEAFFSIAEATGCSATTPSGNNVSNEVKTSSTNNENAINGTIEAKNVASSINENIGIHDVASWVFQIATPTPSLLIIILQIIRQILDIIEQVMEGIFSPFGIAITLLATEILVMLKSLRHNRPKDYNGLTSSRV